MREVVESVWMIVFGFYCFLLVMEIIWFMREEEESIEIFFKIFGENVIRYFIVLFINKDKFDDEGIILDVYLE